ncbi:MAG: serine/threonine protein kinase [Planctomycetota bacterium]
MNDKPTIERWSRIKEIFRAVIAQNPEERALFLDEKCGEEPELRAEIESLIEADSGAGDFMALPAVCSVSSHETGECFLGACIGPYRLVRVISCEGMGIMYEAIQDDPCRHVCIKVMKEGLSSDQAQRRFENDTPIFERLRHRGIVHVIEADTFIPEKDTGQESSGPLPYFVTEYISDVLPITTYAWNNKLSIRKRIQLFLEACEAVQHGHQMGVIHGDLKPGNILVHSSGQVKIMHFGVVSIVGPDLRPFTRQTDACRLIGSLQYRSPEQCDADSKDLDSRSDIYSLGVVLYELLCEKVPYEAEYSAAFDAARLIREASPEKPSTINPALCGDVETILLRALEKERSRRYPSITELTADLQSLLEGEALET